VNKDSKLIYEAYKQSRLLKEYPIDIAGDIDVEPVTKKTLPGQGKKYGGGAIASIAAKQNISEEDVARNMARFILDKMPDKKEVENKTVYHYPGDPKTFRSEITQDFASNFGLSKTDAGYTINYIILYVLKGNQTSGGLKKTGQERKAERIQKVKDVRSKKQEAEQIYEVDLTVKIKDPVIKGIVNSLPNEFKKSEALKVVKDAITEYNQTPGLATKITLKSYDVLPELEKLGVLKLQEVEKEVQQKEGEGTGELPIPEEDKDALDELANDQEFMNDYLNFKESPGDPAYITDYE